MTKEQAEEQKAEMIAIQEFETAHGLETSFGKWFDNKTKQELMYCGTYATEDVVDDKIVVNYYITVRYVSGRGRIFHPRVWKQKIKVGEGKQNRFVPLPL